LYPEGQTFYVTPVARLARGLLMPLLWLLAAVPARAQIVVVPTFPVAAATDYTDFLQDIDVAANPDGTMVFIWGEYNPRSGAPNHALTAQFSSDGTLLHARTQVDTSAHVFDPAISPDTRGGYVAAWRWIINATEYSFFTRRLDAHGVGVDPADFEVNLDGLGPVVKGSVAGLPSGAVFVWAQNGFRGRLYDPAGHPRGDPFLIGAGGEDNDVKALPDGGFVVAWTDGPTKGRVYGADGQPRTNAFTLSSTFRLGHVAVNAAGDLAVVGAGCQGSPCDATDVRARRFAPDGTLLGGEVLVQTADPGVFTGPDCSLDPAGDLYVVWSEYLQATGEGRPPRARALAPDDQPLGPAFPVSDQLAAEIHTTRLANGNFVNAFYWHGEAWASVISLCTPGVSLCGDGVVTPQCEQCDDGAANSDSAPDACRTDCRSARCGDGVVDTGEECDDGNTRDGDCCSSACRNEADTDGDGICDPGDNCPIFPNPDQTHPEVCTPAPYDGLSPADLARFEDGRDEFADIETVDRGLGPIFNGTSCAECHNQPSIGGSSARMVTRFGRYGPGGFDPMTDQGGSLIQAQGISTATCSVPGEVVPAEATVMAHRQTPALFGLGLVDAIPDEAILHYADPADRNGDGISGRPNMVGGRVGRFGWKAQVATLNDFSGEAYLNEMGITSPAFPAELNPQGGPVVCDAVPDPEDDGSNVAAFTDFMTLLAPLPTGSRTPQTRRGRAVFRRIKCGACHLDKLRTGTSPISALSNRRVRAFSDFLLHDLGPGLADGIAQGDATGSEFRTAPLWGMGTSAPYLHDGRAGTLEEAITAHGGEAQATRDRFLALPGLERAALVAYLDSL
jgi:cysteine-rich repeat protein